MAVFFFISLFLPKSGQSIRKKIFLWLIFNRFCKTIFWAAIVRQNYLIKLLKNLVLPKKSPLQVLGLWNREPLKVLNDSKLSLNESKSDHLGSIWYSQKSPSILQTSILAENLVRKTKLQGNILKNLQNCLPARPM